MFNPLLFLFLLQRRRLRNRPCSRAELSQDAPFVVAIGACILSSLVLPLPSAPNDDEESNSVIDTADARFAVMGIISFIPYFNWLVSFFYFNFTPNHIYTTIFFSYWLYSSSWAVNYCLCLCRAGCLRGWILGGGVILCMLLFTWLPIWGSFTSHLLLVCHWFWLLHCFVFIIWMPTHDSILIWKEQTPNISNLKCNSWTVFEVRF